MIYDGQRKQPYMNVIKTKKQESTKTGSGS